MEFDHIIIGIILVIILAVLLIYLSGTGSDISYDIPATGSVKAKNDMMGNAITIKSKLFQTPEKGYGSILPVIEEVKTLLEKSSAVENIVIKTSTNPEWKYKKVGDRELLGYRASSNISYDTKVGDNQQNRDAGLIQNRLVGMSKPDAVITIDSTRYFMSDPQRKALEAMALKNAVEKAKRDALVLLEGTYPGSRYQITGITVSGNNIMIEPPRALMASRQNLETNDIVSQGESTINASIQMKVQIV